MVILYIFIFNVYIKQKISKIIKTNSMYYAKMLYWIYFIHLNILFLVLLLFYSQSRVINCWFCIIDIVDLFFCCFFFVVFVVIVIVFFLSLKKFSLATTRSLDFCAFSRFLHPSQSRSPGFCALIKISHPLKWIYWQQ